MQRIPAIPLHVLGVGVYRVWTETVYINSAIDFPSQSSSSFQMFDIMVIIVLIGAVAFSRYISPLSRVFGIFPLTAVLMAASAFMNFLSILYPQYGGLVAYPAMVCGSLGIALIMMLWFEYYGCINPFRTALYYSASIALGAVVLWVFKGLAFWWLCVGAMTVPAVSLLFLKKSLAQLPEGEKPHKSWGVFQFPWKPVLLVALYSFAYGLRQSLFYSSVLGPHSSFGVVFAALLIFLGVGLYGETFRFTTIWKIALVLMSLSLLPLDIVLPFEQKLVDVLAVCSYTCCLILIMVIFSNLSYRYGVNALWLFGIERAVRLVAIQVGLNVSEAIQGDATFFWADAVVRSAVFVLVVISTFFLLSEKQLSSTWGVILNESPANEKEVLEKNRLGMKCAELAKQFSLSQREEEILLLLAQRKKRSVIEQELFIARSTLKTHVRHIYQKLDIHSKQELYELLGV
jgi:DNA-binding CsgD family transcriptional regulator